MTTTVEKLIQRFEKAKSIGSTWNSLFDLAYSYIFPDRNLAEQLTPGASKNNHIYDLTGQIAAQKFVAKVHMGLTPLFSKWIQLTPGENVHPRQEKQITEQLQQRTNIVFQYIDNSNFSVVMNESYHDLVIGTAALLCLEGPDSKNPFYFRYVPLQEIYPEETVNGELENNWREFNNVPVRDIKSLWPKATLTDSINLALQQKPDTKVNLIEGSLYDETKNEYTYYVISKSDQKILWQESSPSSPWIIFRWEKIRGETYGRGPGIIALPTLITLNLMAQYELDSAELMAYPIYLAYEDTVFNPYFTKPKPKTVIPISPTLDSKGPLFPIPQSGNIEFSQLKVEDLRDQVNKIFFTDPLGPVDAPAKTATEINLRNQQALEEQAPSIGRLMREGTSKIIKRVIFLLEKKGLLPDTKQFSPLITIRYLSPLAMLENSKNVNNILQMAQVLQEVMGAEQASFGFKQEELPQYIAKQFNTNMSLVNSPKEFISKIATLQQAQQNLPTPQPATPQGAL